tara:strand:+ start:1295 stop:1513 length:219 start_codon:yes stop_codon:yes gene_type:complete
MFSTSSLNVDYLSPTGTIGIIVLIFGIIFTLATLYVFYSVTNGVDSILDKKRKEKNKDLQEKKIARLYPKSK